MCTVSCRISDANDAPHVSQKSSSMGFLVPQTAHGHPGRAGSSVVVPAGTGSDPPCGSRGVVVGPGSGRSVAGSASSATGS